MTPVTKHMSRWAARLLYIGVGAVIGAVGAGVMDGPTESTRRRPVRFQIELPVGQVALETAVSPDGRSLVYVAEATDEPVARLFHQSLDRLEPVALPGTQGARAPFFSPDGRWVAFFANDVLLRVGLDGTPPARICDAPTDSAGGAWGDDGSIVFAPLRGRGLSQVPATGGPPQTLTTPADGAGELDHGWPTALPDGGWLFTVTRQGRDPRLAILRPGQPDWRLLLPVTGRGHYLTSGHLTYALDNDLLTVAFDLEAAAIQGTPQVLMRDLSARIARYEGLGQASFAVSPNGTLVSVSESALGSQNALVWVDRTGLSERIVPGVEGLGRHRTPRLSPDDRQAAVAMQAGVMGHDIWIYDLAQRSRARLTRDAGDNRSPTWGPDGRSVTFASNRLGPQNIFSQPVGEAGAARRLLTSGEAHNPTSWSTDGRALAFYEVRGTADRDVWILSADQTARPIVATGADERSPALSPDGRWIAYVSDREGWDAVFVRATRPLDQPQDALVSDGWGREPVWSRDGAELFFRRGDRMLVVDVTAAATFEATAPRRLFERRYESDPAGHAPSYDIAADGRHFLMLQPVDLPTRLSVVLDWTAELTRSTGPDGPPPS